MFVNKPLFSDDILFKIFIKKGQHQGQLCHGIELSEGGPVIVN